MSDSVLEQLAELCGIQTHYADGLGEPRAASRDALVAVLTAFGLDVADDISTALTLEAVQTGRSPITAAECHIAWDGIAPPLPLFSPGSGRYDLSVELESGEQRHQGGKLGDLPQIGEQVRMLTLAEKLPYGYHKIIVRAAGTIVELPIISAPTRVRAPRYVGGDNRPWGLFAPTYALHGDGDLGTGDLGQLRRLSSWVGDLGGSVVGTLPLLATFLDQPCDYSPYAPVSRMFWNELFVDVGSVPELASCPPALAALDSATLRADIAELKAMPLIDYQRAMTCKRQVLELLAAHAWANDGSRARIDAFRERRRQVDDYARFRALVERDGIDPDRGGEADEATWRYHVYVQLLMDEQLDAFAAEPSRAGLYLDLPVGVHRHGYDVWRFADQFADDVSVGAPPDLLFTEGQNWGLPPLLPHRLRATGYDYFARCVRAHMEHADVLRIDHVMGLHRLFWIPPGISATEGVYVHYDADHMYAVMCLESERNDCAVVGEDLGTVPDGVRPMMAERGVRRLHVDQFVFPGQPGHQIGEAPPDAVACVNTHDMPTFAGYMSGKDIEVRNRMGLLDDQGTRDEKWIRGEVRAALAHWMREHGWLAEGDDDLYAAVLAHLLAGPAELVLINIEDLWGETEPQNVPGTGADWPNWRRRMDQSTDEICNTPNLANRLKTALDRGRT